MPQPSMSIKYRSTVPKEWKQIHLNEIVLEYISGGTPSTKKAQYWDGNIAWTTSAPILESSIFLNQAQRFITISGLENSAAHLVSKDNLLIGTRVGVGKAVVNLIDVAISQDLTGLILNKNVALPEFLSYQFKTSQVQQFLEERKRGTTIKGISRFDLQLVKVNLPPLPEQHAIASTLRTVQDAIQARQRELELERERKAALMQTLFSKGTRGEPTKMTEIGEMPEGWKIVRLGDKIILQRGYDLPNSQRENGETPIVSSSGITGTHSVAKVKGPGVVTGRYGTIGQVYYVTQDFWPLNTTLFVSNFHNNNPLFIAYFLSTVNMQSFNDKTSVPGVNRNHVHAMKVAFPSLEEQQTIAETLYACDAKIAALEREIVLHDELFRTLLEDLMTGRIRVPMND